MNPKIIFPLVLVFLLVVGAGVLYVASSAITPPSDITGSREGIRPKLESNPMPKNIPEGTEKKSINTLETEPKDTVDAVIMDLNKYADEESLTAEKESTEVTESNTVSSEQYLNIYDPNEF